LHGHDTNQGDDVSFRYYVWQLGYGLFPWTGLSAAALVAWLRRPDRTRDRQGDASVFMAMWFLSTFGMFTITLTKFHHYIFPLVPPTAVLTGVLVDRLLGKGHPAREGKEVHYVALLSASLMFFVYGIMRLSPRTFLGLELENAPRALAFACLALGALGISASIVRLGKRPPEGRGPANPTPRLVHQRAMSGMLGVVALVPALLAGRDLIVSNEGDLDASVRLMQLFTYNYKRPWPEHLDFTGAFVAFTVATGLALLGLASARLRAHATVAFLVTAVLFGAWGVNVYLVQAAPHWGQRETLLAYYQHRSSPGEPIVAYQMNWKGENFYTGNRIPAFVSSGKKFKDWVAEQKEQGVRVMYFTTEHGRIGSLKRELDNPKSFETITDKKLNNKFALARAEL
jgi:hypothetical protein